MEYIDALINTCLVLGLSLTIGLIAGIPGIALEFYYKKTAMIFIVVGEIINTFALAFITATLIWRSVQGLF